MTIDELKNDLANLNGINLNEESAFNRIQNVIEKKIKLPIITYEDLPVGTILYRSREHKKDEGDFLSIDDLYARNDLENIVDYGRANIPHQSIFYAGDNIATTISEASKIARGELYKEINEVYITTGHFELTEKIKLAVIAHSDNTHDKNEFIDRHRININQIVNEQFPSEAELIIEILKRFSDSFSKNTYGNSNIYKPSCAFAQYAYQVADGIIYPSLQRSFKGINYAIKPEISRIKLKLINAQKDKLIKRKKKEFFHYSSKFLVSIVQGKLNWSEEILTE